MVHPLCLSGLPILALSVLMDTEITNLETNSRLVTRKPDALWQTLCEEQGRLAPLPNWLMKVKGFEPYFFPFRGTF